MMQGDLVALKLRHESAIENHTIGDRMLRDRRRMTECLESKP